MTVEAHTRESIERELELIADEIEDLSVRMEQLYVQRLALWQAGRALDEPMLHTELAAPSRVSHGAVTQALRKVRLGTSNSVVAHG